MPQKPPGSAAQTPSEMLTAEQVAEYLRAHPDFLNENPGVLEALTSPERWSGDMVVDMQRFLIERQRDRIGRLDDYAKELISTGRANLSNQSRTNSAVLSLIAASSLENLIEVVNTDLAVQLDLDVAALCFEQEAEPADPLAALPVAWLEQGAVDVLINHNKEAALHADVLGKPEVFGEAASLVRSQALARLRPVSGAPAGLLALGSRRPNTFHSGQGTENISFLARVLELCLRRRLRG